MDNKEPNCRLPHKFLLENGDHTNVIVKKLCNNWRLSILLLELSTKAPATIVDQPVTEHEVDYIKENSPNYTDVTNPSCHLTISVKVNTHATRRNSCSGHRWGGREESMS